jgi:two-component system sensor histidine kinase UhpB
MDLRVSLVGRLIGFFLLLSALAAAAVMHALREDVAAEIEASALLAELMLSVAQAPDRRLAQISALIERGGLRHLDVLIAGPGGAAPERPQAPAGWLYAHVAPEAGNAAERRIALGDATLVIRPNPASEVAEIVEESSRMLALFVLFALATAIATWRTVGAALRPARALERGLQNLANEQVQRLPAFELREFDRIAREIESIAERLAAARAAEQQMGRRLIEVQEDERRALARELHDEIGQALTAVGLSAAYLERHGAAVDAAAVVACAKEIREGVANVSAKVLGVLKALRPHGLDGLGLIDALRDLLDFWQGRCATVAVEARLPATLPPLSSQAALSIYRTLQEALTNVHRHSGARRVRVRLGRVDDGVELRVEDDGSGRAESAALRPSGGMLGMQERARLAGGSVRFHASGLGGFGLTLWVPPGAEGMEDGAR